MEASTTPSPVPGSDAWHDARASEARSTLTTTGVLHYAHLVGAAGVNVDQLSGLARASLAWLAQQDPDTVHGVAELFGVSRALKAMEVRELFHELGADIGCGCGATDHQHPPTTACRPVAILTGLVGPARRLGIGSAS